MAHLVPADAWDTHTHVFDPAKFPFSKPRSYTPSSAQISEYPRNITGCSNVVVVHASIQGPNPAALLDTLAKSPEVGLTLSGLATIDVNTITDEELDKLHAAGVRGTRLHEMAWGHGQQSGGSDIIKKIEALAKKLARLEWVIDIFCPVTAWAAMAPMIRAMDPRIKMVADHIGGTFPGEEKTEAFATFLQLIKEKRIYVKFSGFERLYEGVPGKIESLTPIAVPILEAGPDRIMFGSDWPHTQLGISRKGKTDQQRLVDIEGFRTVDNTGHIVKLREWIKDEGTWQNFWCTTPRKVFG